ncbi:MAG: site-specific DNA-methyltransferase, partial [Caulobacteraceae bacterium]
DGAHSFGERDAGNLLVEGDNLEALKALLPFYAGKVKCIYIDPPYNTGNEGWVYNDNVNSPEIRAWLGKVTGKEAEDLSRHDKWLCMMYPRLRILREFLAMDGSIFVSIDHNELSNLLCLMNEIFSGQNMVATISWQKRYSRENRGDIGDAHEHIVIYSRHPERFRGSFNKVPLDAKSSTIYKNPNNDPKGRWRVIPMTAQGFRPNQMYPIEAPSGRILRPPVGRCWSMIEPEFEKLKGIGRISFGKKGDSAPGVLRYLSEVEGLVPWTWWPHDEVGHTDEAKKEIMAFGFSVNFETPKPVRLLTRIIQIATSPGDLILDSFAGSGTTAVAVAREGQGRRFILVEMDPAISKSVTAARLRATFQDANHPKEIDAVEIDRGGFRYCTLGKPLFDEWGAINVGVSFADLAAFAYFSDTGSPIPACAADGDPLIGTFAGRAIYLLFSPDHAGVASAPAGNVLTVERLGALPLPAPGWTGPRTVYGEGCTVPAERLAAAGVTFKQVPYQLAGA